MIDKLTKEEKAIFFRGKFITHFAEFEKTIDFRLSEHYAKNRKKQYEMINVVFDRMTFESKRTALKALYDKKSEEDGFVKTKNNSYPHSELFNDMRILNDHRNYFAHYMLHPSNSIKDATVIILTELRDKISPKMYTESQIYSLIDKMYIIGNEILTKKF